MTEPVVRVGFIGGGLIARYHARQLSEVAGTEVVACHDVDADRAAELVAGFGGAVVDSVAEVIDASDAVYVCTWTSAHPEMVDAVAAAGKPLFCEKPLGVDFITAEAMTATVVGVGDREPGWFGLAPLTGLSMAAPPDSRPGVGTVDVDRVP